MISVEINPSITWTIRFGNEHESYGDNYSGVMTASSYGHFSIRFSGMVGLPSKREIRDILEYFRGVGYTQFTWERYKNNCSFDHEVNNG